jgi:hypothetical protein
MDNRLRKLVRIGCFLILARLSAHGGIDWRPIDPQDLALKTPVVEKDADAEAIFWEVWLDDAAVDKTVFTHYLLPRSIPRPGATSGGN